MPDSSAGFAFTLADSTRVLLRPVRPEDRDRIREGIAKMSPHSRYLRFFTGGTQLTEQQLRRLAELDPLNEVAWGALDPQTPGLPGLGLSRFVRVRDEPDVAETAIAVLDSCQGRGLGRILLALLYISAPKLNIRTLRGLVLPENSAVSGWFARLGATVRFRGDLDIADLPVHDDLGPLPENPSAQRFKDAIRALRQAM